MADSRKLIHGAAYILCAEFVAVVMGATAKSLQESLPLEVIIFSKSFFALTFLLPIFFHHRFSDLSTAVPHWHFLRMITGLGGMYAYFYTVGQLKLANAIALALTTPIVLPIVAYFLIAERMQKLATVPILLGFAGVTVMLRPEVAISLAVFIGLTGGVLVAAAQVSIRRLTRSEPEYRIVFYFCLGSVLVTAIPLHWSWQLPTTASQIVALIALGPLALTTQLLYIRGFALAPASQISMFAYSSVPFGALLGWFFWDEIWDPLSILGTLLIVCAGGIMLRINSKSTIK